MSKTTSEKLNRGDIVLDLLKDGSTKLAICTAGYQVYDRQGGEGATIQYENGTGRQFSYYQNEPVLIIESLKQLDSNPLRQLLVWRQQFEH